LTELLREREREIKYEMVREGLKQFLDKWKTEKDFYNAQLLLWDKVH
jgi:hypothetical protein